MADLLAQARTLHEAIALAGSQPGFAWLRFASVDSFVQNVAWGEFWLSVATIRDYAWREPLRNQLVALDRAEPERYSQATTLSLLEFALAEQRCDVIQALIPRLKEGAKLTANSTLFISRYLESLVPVIGLLLPFVNLEEAPSHVLNERTLPYFIPYLGGIPRDVIARLCDSSNIHCLVANGICSYEVEGALVIHSACERYRWTADEQESIPRIPVSDETRTAMRMGSSLGASKYWRYFATDEEKAQLMALSHHTRPYIVNILDGRGVAVQARTASESRALLEEIPKLPPDVGRNILYSISELHRGLLYKLDWPDTAVYDLVQGMFPYYPLLRELF